MELLSYNEYGETGKQIVVLHGGPAAAGSVEPIAKELGRYCKVLEPFQREACVGKLTVSSHVQDLYNLVKAKYRDDKPILIGHSWGAMLALAYAAKYGHSIDGVILIGCGTFDEYSRIELKKRHKKLMTKEKQKQLNQIESITDTDEKNRQLAYFYDVLYAYDMIKGNKPIVRFDLKSHIQSWNNMVKQQEAGIYPQLFSEIKNPVVMIHGQFDPHPGRMIFENLKQHIDQLDYIELDKCGHSPWNEKYAKGEFYTKLKMLLL